MNGSFISLRSETFLSKTKKAVYMIADISLAFSLTRDYFVEYYLFFNIFCLH